MNFHDKDIYIKLILRKLLGPIQNALPEIRQSIENLSMAQLCFEKFGKGEMKKWRLSPGKE